MAPWAPPLFKNGLDLDAVDGAAEPAYDLPNILVNYVRQEPPGIQTAFWRGVGPTHNIFVVESFIDELAAAARQDALEYRRALLAKSPRAKRVLELAEHRQAPPRACGGVGAIESREVIQFAAVGLGRTASPVSVGAS